jgi:SulP family sulfate permease
VHYLLAFIVGAGHLGTTWSGVDGLLPPFSIWHFTQAEGVAPLLHWLPTVLPYALAIAAIASLESMLCLPAVEAATHRKPDSNRELWSQGLSNLVAGLMGGFPSEAVTSRSMANLQAGGRSRFSGLFYSLGLGLLLLFGSQWIGLVPEAVTAGLILYLAYTLIDDGTRRLVRQLIYRNPDMPRFQYRMLWANALVLVTVALVAIFGDMLKATGVGVVLGMMLFILTSMKPVIRTMATGASRRSLKVRTPEAAALLEREGGRIQIAELEGILFFGTAERVALEIGALPESVRIMILDFGRVREIDATAARTLLQLARRVKGRGQRLFLCGAGASVEADLNMAGLREVVPGSNWFDDGDRALEAAEEILLGELQFQRADVTLPLAQTMLAAGLQPHEIDTLAFYLEHRTLETGSHLFEQGDRGDSLFVAASGVIDICLPLRNGRKKRVASFAPGVIVGEMAFIEQQPRSAAGQVEGDTQLWELTRTRFDEMAADHPMVAHRIMMNLSRGLSQRLRTTTQSLRAASDAGDFVVRSGALPVGAVERRRQPA